MGTYSEKKGGKDTFLAPSFSVIFFKTLFARLKPGVFSKTNVRFAKENKKRPVRTPPTPFSQPVPQMQYKSKNFSILNDSTVCLKISTCMLDAPEMQAASFWWLGAFLHFVGEDPPLS